MKKNILFLNCDSLWFGSEKILFNIIKILKDHFNCFVVLPYKGIFIKRLKDINIFPIIVDYPVIRKKYFSVLGFFNYSMNFFKSLFVLTKIIKENNIDIIYSNSITVLEGLLLSIIKNKKHIWHIHSIIEKPKIIFLILNYLLSLSELNIFVSKSLFNKYKLSNFKKNIILNNGIDKIIINKNKEKIKKKFTIGTIGTFNEQKGQIYLLYAINFLIKKYKIKDKIKILMTGPVYEKNNIWFDNAQKYIKENNLNDITQVNGFIPDIEKIYQEIDFFVLPSVIFDPFPTVVLESISCKIPVVAFKSGGVDEILNFDNNCLVNIKDYKTLAELIYKYYSNKKIRKDLAVKQFDFYKRNFTYEIFKNKLLKIIFKYLNYEK